MYSLILVFGVLPALAFQVYDCSNPSPQGIYKLLSDEDCDGLYPPTVSERKVVGSLLQVPRYVSIPAVSARAEYIDDTVYCTYYRLRTKLISSRNYESYSPAQFSLSVVRSWITKSELTLSHTTLPLQFGTELVVIDSKDMDEEGFCKVHSVFVKYRVFRFRFQHTTVKAVLDHQGSVTSYSSYNEQVIKAAPSGEGLLADGSMIFWDPKDIPTCPWELVFSGSYWLATNQGSTNVAVFPSLSTGVTLGDTTHQCDVEVHTTSDPQLYVSQGHTVRAPRLKADSAASWSSLIRTSVQYVGTTITLQLANVTKTVELNQCLLEQKIQRDTLYSAHTSPELVGYRLTGEYGTAVVVSGAAIQILQCKPLEAKIRPTQLCYEHVPIIVSGENRSVFMDPVTYVMVDSSSQLNCQDPQVPFFEIRGGWYRMIPHKTSVTPPNTLPSDLRSLINLTLLSYTGLYPEEVLGHEETKWLFKSQREATLNGLLNWGNRDIGDPTHLPQQNGDTGLYTDHYFTSMEHSAAVVIVLCIMALWLVGLTWMVAKGGSASAGISCTISPQTAITVPVATSRRDEEYPLVMPRTRGQMLKELHE